MACKVMAPWLSRRTSSAARLSLTAGQVVRGLAGIHAQRQGEHTHGVTGEGYGPTLLYRREVRGVCGVVRVWMVSAAQVRRWVWHGGETRGAAVAHGGGVWCPHFSFSAHRCSGKRSHSGLCCRVYTCAHPGMDHHGGDHLCAAAAPDPQSRTPERGMVGWGWRWLILSHGHCIACWAPGDVLRREMSVLIYALPTFIAWLMLLIVRVPRRGGQAGVSLDVFCINGSDKNQAAIAP